MRKLESYYCPDHRVVRPAIGSSHHLHICTHVTLIGPHDDIVSHVRLLSSWVLPSSKMVLFLLKPCAHDGEFMDGAKLPTVSHQPRYSYQHHASHALHATRCCHLYHFRHEHSSLQEVATHQMLGLHLQHLGDLP